MRKLLPFAAIILLAACEGNEVRQTLGLDKNVPDEFKVVSRPPLNVPPELTLRPPSPDAPATNLAPTDEKAEQILFGRSPLSSGTAETAIAPVSVGELESAGESTFRKNLGTRVADPNIRQRLRQDKAAKKIEKEEQPWYEDFDLFKSDEDPIVDAHKEAERIIKNREEGKPINEGEVEVIKPEEQTTIERLF